MNSFVRKAVALDASRRKRQDGIESIQSLNRQNTARAASDSDIAVMVEQSFMGWLQLS